MEYALIDIGHWNAPHCGQAATDWQTSCLTPLEMVYLTFAAAAAAAAAVALLLAAAENAERLVNGSEED